LLFRETGIKRISFRGRSRLLQMSGKKHLKGVGLALPWSTCRMQCVMEALMKKIQSPPT